MKATPPKYAVLGRKPVVRVVADDGFGDRPVVLRCGAYALAQDEADVERVLPRVVWIGSLNPRAGLRGGGQGTCPHRGPWRAQAAGSVGAGGGHLVSCGSAMRGAW